MPEGGDGNDPGEGAISLSDPSLEVEEVCANPPT
jgi:hypothetical protein